ncbi:MAG: glycosyltransferase family 4 protein [Cocleimonas sp.]
MKNVTKINQKVIAIHLLNDFSGSPLVLANLIDALTQDGIEVELLTSGNNGFLSRCTCRIQYFNYKRFNNKFLTLGAYIYSQIELFFRVFSSTIFLAGAKKPKVLINTILPFGATLGAKLAGCEIIYYVHEVSIKPKILKLFLKFIIRAFATDIIYVSNYLKNAEGLNKTNLVSEHVIYNSLPPFVSPLTSAPVRKDFTVFMASSLKRYKGVYEFVEIAERLVQSDVRFILALNAEETEFEHFIFETKNLPNLIVLRRPDNITDIYKAASLTVNLSHPGEWIETFGMTVIEAFSNACPVIVPKVGGIAEIVDDQVNGFQMSVCDCNAIAELIYKIANDKCLYKSLSSNALITAKKYLFENYKKKVVVLFSR